jgi:putative transposase
VRFLRHLRRHLAGPVVLFWDGLNAHRSLETRAHLEAQRSWLTVHRLPAYAPELNPVEGVWAWFKGTATANLCPDGLAPLRQRLRTGRRRAPVAVGSAVIATCFGDSSTRPASSFDQNVTVLRESL